MINKNNSETAINLYLNKMMVLQQDNLNNSRVQEYFKDSPCHIYFICRRPRITLNIAKTFCDENQILLTFKVHTNNGIIEVPIHRPNDHNNEIKRIDSIYPFNTCLLYTSKIIINKIQGKSIKKKAKDTMPSEDEVVTKTNSTSQQSYDRQIDHLTSLVQLLEKYPTYTPNEYTLSIKGLQEKLTLLKSTNTNHINSYTAYNNAMIARDRILYNTDTGLVKTSKNVKQYIKSIFGATGPEYKQVTRLEFKKISL